MKPETYGLKLIKELQPDAVEAESDLMGAAFSIGDFRNTYGKMTPEQRNKMKELGWFQDPCLSLNTWIFVPELQRHEKEIFEKVKPKLKEPAPVAETVPTEEKKEIATIPEKVLDETPMF